MRLFPHHGIHLISGLTIWSAWFVVLYGGLSVGCQLAPPLLTQGPATWLNILLGLSTLVVVAVLLALAWHLWRQHAEHEQQVRRFICLTSAALYLVSALATLAVALPVLFLPPCI